jgi:hypothetical protein
MVGTRAQLIAVVFSRNCGKFRMIGFDMLSNSWEPVVAYSAPLSQSHPPHGILMRISIVASITETPD